MGAAGVCTSPGCTLFPRGAEAISSSTLQGFYGPPCVIPVHAGMDVGQGTGSPAAFPACRQCAESASNHSSSLDRQMDTLGKSICDSCVQQGTSRCLHTTGCSSAVQQVLRDGKVQKTQRNSKSPAEQEQEHVHFQGWCVGSREPKGSRAPSPPVAVPGRLPTTACMKRGGC